MQKHIRRRAVLAGLPAMALAASAGNAFAKANFPVPDGACDCHHHIYDPRFPYQPHAMLKPPPATVADYRRQVQRRLGVSRSVAVTPSTYGTDNRCMLDALKQLGKASRGVAVFHPDIADKELKAMHDAGVRGARVQFGRGSIVGAEEVEPLGKRLHDMGWHLQLNMTGKDYLMLGPVLLRLKCPIVFDHLAHIDMPGALKSDHYKLVLKVLDTGRGWVKLSSPYTDSKIGPPDYPDTSALARAYLAHAPERMLWASNWPYPDVPPGSEDPLALLNILQSWAPDAGLRHRILVENPESLYGFDPASRPKAISG